MLGGPREEKEELVSRGLFIRRLEFYFHWLKKKYTKTFLADLACSRETSPHRVAHPETAGQDTVPDPQVGCVLQSSEMYMHSI